MTLPSNKIEGSHYLPRAVKKVFENGGPLSKLFNGYNYRENQVSTAQLIALAISEGKAAFAEAGTGTGKSLASLIPASIYAAVEGKRVLVVAPNIALQQELYRGDIPTVEKVLGLMGLKFKPALLKGKGNFVCLDALQKTFKERNPEDREELAKFHKYAMDKNNVKIGDKDLLPYEPSQRFWSKISYNMDRDCSGCIFKKKGLCFVDNHVKEAEEANLIITNHHSLLNDVVRRMKNNFAPKSGTLPDYDVVIVDEGHQLEHIASDIFSTRLKHQSFYRLIMQMRVFFKRKGPLKEYNESRRQQLMDLTNKLDDYLTFVFSSVQSRFQDSNKRADLLEYHILGDFIGDTTPVNNLVSELYFNKTRLNDKSLENRVNYFITTLKELEEDLIKIKNGVINDERDYVFWAEKDFNSQFPDIIATPISIARFLKEGLFSRMPTILMSATMKLDKDFGLFAKKMGNLKEDEYLSVFVDAPFDYAEQACLYVPANALEVPKNGDIQGQKKYDEYCLREMEELVTMSKGRAFILFTSNYSLNQYYDILAPRFEKMGYKCFKQGGGLDRNQIIKEFKEHGNAVLFGSSSFWEGVSVEGRELSLVIVHRIPFSPVTPVNRAQENYIREQGGDPFMECRIFPALIQYKQGFGRLIRKETDKGVFAVLDGRIFTRKDTYGKYFIKGVPYETFKTVHKEDLIPYFE